MLKSNVKVINQKSFIIPGDRIEFKKKALIAAKNLKTEIVNILLNNNNKNFQQYQAFDLVNGFATNIQKNMNDGKLTDSSFTCYKSQINSYLSDSTLEQDFNAKLEKYFQVCTILSKHNTESDTKFNLFGMVNKTESMKALIDSNSLSYSGSGGLTDKELLEALKDIFKHQSISISSTTGSNQNFEFNSKAEDISSAKSLESSKEEDISFIQSTKINTIKETDTTQMSEIANNIVNIFTNLGKDERKKLLHIINCISAAFLYDKEYIDEDPLFTINIDTVSSFLNKYDINLQNDDAINNLIEFCDNHCINVDESKVGYSEDMQQILTDFDMFNDKAKEIITLFNILNENDGNTNDNTFEYLYAHDTSTEYTITQGVATDIIKDIKSSAMTPIARSIVELFPELTSRNRDELHKIINYISVSFLYKKDNIDSSLLIDIQTRTVSRVLFKYSINLSDDKVDRLIEFCRDKCIKETPGIEYVDLDYSEDMLQVLKSLEMDADAGINRFVDSYNHLKVLDLGGNVNSDTFKKIGSYLFGINLDEYNLSKIDLNAVGLTDASLKSANLEHANLKGANLASVKLELASLTGADLTNVNLEWANLKNANLVGANLKGAYLIDVNLRAANLRDTDLTGAYLGGANLTDADLEDANLENANLTGANLENVNLKYANLKGANLKNVDLKNTTLRGADMRGADMRGADMRGAIINKETKLLISSSTGINFAGVNFIGKPQIEFEFSDDLASDFNGDDSILTQINSIDDAMKKISLMKDVVTHLDKQGDITNITESLKNILLNNKVYLGSHEIKSFVINKLKANIS